MKKTKKTKKTKANLNDEGFTLVELIIVIAIMAILAGAIAISFIRYVDRARESNCISMRNTMEKDFVVEKQEEEEKHNEASNGTYVFTMQDFLDAHPEHKCPDGGTFEPSSDGMSVDCTKHGSLH